MTIVTSRYFTATAAACTGVFTYTFLPVNIYNPAVAEIVTVLGFLMAAFVPAMALGATALRAGSFPVSHIRKLNDAIRIQIGVFGGLLYYCLIACILLICGKMTSWENITLSLINGNTTVHLGAIFTSLISATLTTVLLRFNAFIAGVMSILDLTTELAEAEARERDAFKNEKAIADLENYQLPDDYGQPISH